MDTLIVICANGEGLRLNLPADLADLVVDWWHDPYAAEPARFDTDAGEVSLYKVDIVSLSRPA